MTKQIILIIIIMFSCQQGNNKAEITQENKIVKSKTSINYAKGFNIEYFENHKLITVYNPWNNNSIYWQYYIYNDSLDSKITKKDNVFYIKSRINSTIALSGTQIAFLDKLNLLNKITAISESKYIYNKKIIDKIKNSSIAEVGDVMNLNYEKIIFQSPDIVFATGWDKFNNSLEKVSKAGIPIAYVIEWQENTPLARAEWIKYIAAFYNKEEQADSIFNSIAENYNILKQNAQKAEHKPTILHGSLQGEMWYIPGGKSYVANLYKDANTNYLWSDNTEKGSLPLSFEQVFLKGKQADIWFTNEMFNGDSIFIPSDERYKLFKSYKTNKLYANTNRITKFGGNDYWESGVINPDIILQDIISIIHPELENNNKKFYFKHLLCE